MRFLKLDRRWAQTRLPLIPLLACLTALSLPLAGSANAEGETASATPPRTTVDYPIRVVGEEDGVPVYRKEILFEVHEVDQIYTSMRGPRGVKVLKVDLGEGPELLWVRRYASGILEPDGVTPASREFMCHSNMSMKSAPTYSRLLGTELKPTGGRLFSLAQGQLEIELPKGFAVPVMSNLVAGFDAQVLNHNIDDRTFEIRQKVSIDFVRDRDLLIPPKPLIPRAVFGMKLLDGPDGYYAMSSDEVDEEQHGPGCLPGVDAGSRYSHAFTDPMGRKFTGFWLVEPGTEVNRTPVTKLLALPYDTRLHYAVVHAHPFATSVELRDLTTGETVYKSRLEQTEGRIGLAKVEYLSSEEGLPLYKDHDYEVVSVYENSSGEVQDAMATMFLYLHAKDLSTRAVRARLSKK